MSLIYLKFSDGDGPNLCRVKKVDVSSSFIENIFRSGLTPVSSWDCFCQKDFFMNTIIAVFCSSNILCQKCLVLRFTKYGLLFLHLQNWRIYCKICTNFNLLNKSKFSIAVITRKLCNRKTTFRLYLWL